MNEGFENEVRRLVRRIMSSEGVRQCSLAASLSTPSDTVSKSQISQWLQGRKGLGRDRFDRLIVWLAANGHPVIVPEYKEKEIDDDE